MDHTIIAARVQAAHDKLRAMGHEKARVQLQIGAWHYVSAKAARPQAVVELGGYATIDKVLFETFDTIELALDAIDAAVHTAPRAWSVEDVAATLGIIPAAPLCESCEERPATTTLHDEHDHAFWSPRGHNPAVCEPCLESAADREAERAMEG